jgi:NAD(P)-dependent dehydrogenase (short-subunit alcohol dehydrogenase family)
MGTVLITGCSSGFGHLSALTLARKGERVYATMRDPDAGAELTATAAAEELALTVHRLDVTDEQSVAAVVGELLDDAPIDALVNNAGQRGPRGPLTTLSDAELLATLDVNTLGIVRMIRAVAPSMIARGSGTIVNVSSLAGLVAPPYEAPYGISKHAVEALSESARWELGLHGIRVFLIEPGSFATNFFATDHELASFGTDHPERATYELFSTAIANALITEHLQDPQRVADAVCDAVLGTDDRFRRLVGGDAELICTAKRELPYEQFETRMRAMTGIPQPANARSQP